MHLLEKKESQITYANTIHFETLGCRLNQIESEAAANFFYNDGFKISMQNLSNADEEDSSVILSVINTCTVTAKAEQKCRRVIRLTLKKFPLATVLVTGCYAQTSPIEIANIDKRIAVLPGRVKSRLSEIPKIVKDFYSEEKQPSAESAIELANKLSSGICSGLIPKVSENAFKLSAENFFAHSRPSIKIQDGCSYKCSYCGICLARGGTVSLPVKDVIEQVNKMQKAGQKEVVFTTVNIGQYRGEYNGKFVDFVTLLEILLSETKDIAFRFSSLYPEVVNCKFSRLAKDERVRPHFHLSVQSGSDKILKLMNRPYEMHQVLEAVEMLKDAKGNPFLACDIITGFPGETDEDFEETLDLCKKCGFTWIHAFPFSPRPNTVAYNMKPKVPEYISKQRIQKLLNLACENKIEYIKSMIGTPRVAITESTKNPNTDLALSSGRIIHAVTDNFIHVETIVESEEDMPPVGSQIKVNITSALEQRIRNGFEWEALGNLVKI